MKVIKKVDEGSKTKSYRLPVWLLKELNRLAVASGKSENALVSAILQKAVKDPKFSVEV